MVLPAAEVAETKSALETDSQGWVDILPAEDLKGWFRVAVPPNARLGRDQWHVDGKVLICDGDGGHDMLLFDKEIGTQFFTSSFATPRSKARPATTAAHTCATQRDGSFWHQAQFGDGNDGYLFGQTAVNGYGKKNFNSVSPSDRQEGQACREWNTWKSPPEAAF